MNMLSTNLGILVAADLVDVRSVLGALIYSAIGLVLFGIAWFLIVKVSPFSIRKEIEEDQNTALGIIIGAVIIGIAMIISSAVGG
jgi:uncharacterized membrane protein YjfL (UPF0719 family)